MSLLTDLLNLVLHIDVYLGQFIQAFGPMTYALLFAIVFCETGLVVTPFLPGDSLIFISGALAGAGTLDMTLLFVVFTAAAIIGDSVNYWIGHRIGPKVFHERAGALFKEEYVGMAHDFFEKHGGKAIVLARFVPIVRTFAPFVAGMGSMSYGRFFLYNVAGGVVWVAMFLAAGYFFGGLPIVEDNLSLLVLGIIAVSLVPAAVKILPTLLKGKKAHSA